MATQSDEAEPAQDSVSDSTNAGLGEGQSESRRFVRRPGGWWWGALFGVPLVLALVGSTVVMTNATKSTASAEPDLAPSAAQSPTNTVVTPISLTRSGDQVTITGSFPDEAGRQAAVVSLQNGLGAGLVLVDQTNLAQGAVGLPPQLAVAMGNAAQRVRDLGVRTDGSTITLTGTVTTAAAKQQVIAGITNARGSALVADQLQIATDCSTVAVRVKQVAGKGQIRFSYNASKPTKEAAAAVWAAAALLTACPAAKVTLKGYADRSGPAKVNKQISADRAKTVRHKLRALGVKNSIAVMGYGDHHPIGNNSTAKGRAANRRVVITIP